MQVRELLAQAGFKNVKTAPSGAEARQILASEPMDLILSDWRMAPVGGLELLASLREDPKLKSIPFVMLTAESTKERVVSAIRSGVDDYIVKPLSVDLVQTKVMGVLLRKQVI